MAIDNDHLLNLAALNNAEWCNIVCEANGAPGQFEYDLWSSVYKVPVYYPNIVTLKSNTSREQVKRVAQQIPGTLSVKDSFNNLNLAQIGYTKLFEATWFLAPELAEEVFKFKMIDNSDQLKKWEVA